MKYLSELELDRSGSQYSMVSEIEDGTKKLMPLVCVNQNRRYFISTTSSTNLRIAYERMRWRQTSSGPRCVRITVEQPKILEVYHSTYASVDQHKRCHAVRTIIYSLNARLK